MKVKINLEKLVNSLLQYAEDNCEETILDYLHSALQDQGLEYKDGEIVKRQVDDFDTELQESEDERIRQKFIKLVKMSSEVGGYALHKWEADEMLAWLEKQGKQQSQIEVIDWLNTIDAACDECYINAYASGEYCHHQSFKWGFQEGVKWLEEQSEQKPTWTEEDEDYLNDLERYFINLEPLKHKAIEAAIWLKSMKQRKEWRNNNDIRRKSI